MFSSTAHLYRSTATRLNCGGWTQDQWTGDNGEECLVQALGQLAGVGKRGRSRSGNVVRLPLRVVMPLLLELGLSTDGTRRELTARLWEWNDRDDVDFDNVRSLLLRTAAALEAMQDNLRRPLQVPSTNSAPEKELVSC